ncbi:hemolysin XhlA family protein [Sarcina ventriculi]|uniref:hemolysin XhlA family protein n=1 Tax=Sarcina ventriculi TaxID=1267 RepID=UPI0018AC1A86|nr:hemolysin XhlA family protein [Sarcina ventriculi]
MEETLHDHEKRISDLEKNSIRTEERHNNLMEKLDNLTGILKWVGITSAGAMVSIFIFVIQQNLK